MLTKVLRRSEQAKLEGFDAVVHLAGDNVADGNWSEAKKRSIQGKPRDRNAHLG